MSRPVAAGVVRALGACRAGASRRPVRYRRDGNSGHRAGGGARSERGGQVERRRAAARRVRTGRGRRRPGRAPARTVLRERDLPGGANIGLIDLVARHALDHGFHTVVEGILAAERYGPMLARLAADHRGRSHLYYLDADFDETVRRHATRPQAAEFSPEDMADWYQPHDLLPGGLERVVPQHSTLDETVERILADTRLTPPFRHR
ncbi:MULTISPECIES: kinase [unclassified Kitasatospora]|uniref:kinase n=1 Tax=unclassified Kitasatospora TaxID=2633591 RepID=UPI00382FFBC8